MGVGSTRTRAQPGPLLWPLLPLLLLSPEAAPAPPSRAPSPSHAPGETRESSGRPKRAWGRSRAGSPQSEPKVRLKQRVWGRAGLGGRGRLRGPLGHGGRGRGLSESGWGEECPGEAGITERWGNHRPEAVGRRAGLWAWCQGPKSTDRLSGSPPLPTRWFQKRHQARWVRLPALCPRTECGAHGTGWGTRAWCRGWVEGDSTRTAAGHRE